jgi:hypothetical protein
MKNFGSRLNGNFGKRKNWQRTLRPNLGGCAEDGLFGHRNKFQNAALVWRAMNGQCGLHGLGLESPLTRRGRARYFEETAEPLSRVFVRPRSVLSQAFKTIAQGNSDGLSYKKSIPPWRWAIGSETASPPGRP